jgi:3-oxoacyl-[acyl-carrier protein] reductase
VQEIPSGVNSSRRRTDVNGKAAFITGGGTGVGRATALALAAQGCDVAVNYSRSQQAAEQTAADVQALEVNAIALQGDVAEDVDCRRMVAQTIDAFGRLDGLVNSAGTTVFVPHHDLDGITADDWHWLYSVNTMGTFQMMRAAAPHLRADGGGEVISISSVSGVAGVGSSLPYCASKAALNNLAVTMARVLAPEVQVNAVAPGFFTGRWWKEGQGDDVHDAVAEAAAKSVPLKAVCDPEDVADACMGFIQGSDLATGQMLVVACSFRRRVSSL